ncbi:MAG: CDP-diacylglycerol--glycerol-3-phosphate 3-phosphatidyltransferase, partial [Clostridia bacterium]|nr:CDP-diacylglycerol--glycerol-3-phosphate 3-phosphatidyltransferase [Clostridia bacterium]
NGLTVLRVLLTAVLAVFLLAPSFVFDEGTTRIFCAVVFFVAALTDFLDGAIARGANTVSDFGKFLDPVADKLLILSSFICLAVSGLTDDSLRVLFAATAVVLLFRELAVTSLRLLAASRGLVLAARGAGKVKTFVQCVAVMWIILEPLFAFDGARAVSVILTGLCILCTLYSGLAFVPAWKRAMQTASEKGETK